MEHCCYHVTHRCHRGEIKRHSAKVLGAAFVGGFVGVSRVPVNSARRAIPQDCEPMNIANVIREYSRAFPQ